MKRKQMLAVMLAIAMAATPVAATLPAGVVMAEGETEQTLPAAVNGIITIKENGTYPLSADVTDQIVVNEGVTATLDLKGHNINATGTAIVNKGTLTIENTGSQSDSAGVVKGSKGAIGNVPGATCNIKGGRYTSSSWYVIKNLGTMTIDKNTEMFNSETSKDFSSLIDNGYYGNTGNDTILDTYYDEGNAKPVKLTIKNGHFDGGKNTVKNDDYGILIIEDGSFSNTSQVPVFNVNDTTINGGTFDAISSADKTAVFTRKYDDKGNVGKVNITGGTFKAENLLETNDTEHAPVINISGGDFSDITSTLVNPTGTKIEASSVILTGGTFNSSVDVASAATIPEGTAQATVKSGASTTFAIGQNSIKAAADDKDNEITVTRGSVDFTNPQAKISNAENNTSGAVTVDGNSVEAGKTYVKPEEKPADTKPIEKPAETKPAEKPAETKPASNPNADTVTGTWVRNGTGWWLRKADGTWPANKWECINGEWYFFDSNGYIKTGWQLINGAWYYLKPAVNGNESNMGKAAHPGWNWINGKWYFMNGSNAMTTGWQYVNNTWYFMDASGAMATGWRYINGAWYYMNGSGAMQTGWQFINGKWYFMNTSGAMLTGWQFINNKWYYLDASGAMASNEYVDGYWLSADGAWTYQYVGSWKRNRIGWWYGDDTGWYAKNQTEKIDGTLYKFNANGYWIRRK